MQITDADREASTAALTAEIQRLRKHLREIGLSATVCAHLTEDEEERVPWEMIAKRAGTALSTPSEVSEPEAIGGGETGKVENRPRLLAMDHVNSIEEPIRGVDERGHPYLSYSVAHVQAAYVAGMEKARSLATPQPVSGDAVREALEAILKASSVGKAGQTVSFRSKYANYPAKLYHAAQAALNHGGTQS